MLQIPDKHLSLLYPCTLLAPSSQRFHSLLSPPACCPLLPPQNGSKLQQHHQATAGSNTIPGLSVAVDIAAHSSFVKRSSHPVSGLLHISLCPGEPLRAPPQESLLFSLRLLPGVLTAPGPAFHPKLQLPPLKKWLQITTSSPDPLLSRPPNTKQLTDTLVYVSSMYNTALRTSAFILPLGSPVSENSCTVYQLFQTWSHSCLLPLPTSSLSHQSTS